MLSSRSANCSGDLIKQTTIASDAPDTRSSSVASFALTALAASGAFAHDSVLEGVVIVQSSVWLAADDAVGVWEP